MRLLKFFTIFFITVTEILAFQSRKNEKFHSKSEVEREHFKYPNIRKICADRKLCIKDRTTNVCAMRSFRRRFQYKVFDNACALFLSNMCEYPGQEFHIVTSGDCWRYYQGRKYYKQRRMSVNNTSDYDRETNLTDGGNESDYYSDEYDTDEEKPILRGDNTTTEEVNETKTSVVNRTTTVKRVTCPYNITSQDGDAWDVHPCPCFCTDAYQPECLVVNRNEGKYLKFLTFINHCHGDMYYCKHWEDFENPVDKDSWPDIKKSPLGWSYCGSTRYVEFARFAEVTSSMSHYGWLLGHQRATYIFGKKERELYKDQIVRVYSPAS